MIKKCYLCNRKANFILKNGKYCCSKSVNSCPAKTAKATTRKGINLGKKNGNWKGNLVSYNALHRWIKSRLTKPKLCPSCYKKRKLQLSCKNHKYIRKLSQWRYLCQSCHKIVDKQVGRKKYFCKICQKQISSTSGKYGEGRCGSCAKIQNQRRNK
jgi:hypothetical protein